MVSDREETLWLSLACIPYLHHQYFVPIAAHEPFLNGRFSLCLHNGACTFF